MLSLYPDRVHRGLEENVAQPEEQQERHRVAPGQALRGDVRTS